MRRTCERPGCAEPATVAFGMVPEDLAVWLEAVDPSTLGEVRPRCSAPVTPTRWSSPRAGRSTTAANRCHACSVCPCARPRSAVPGDHTARIRRPRPEDWAELALFDEPAPAVQQTPPEQTTIVEPDEGSDGSADAPADAGSPDASAAPWKPRFDRSDDLDGLLTARSPLLRRAFGFDDEGTDGRPG